MNTADAPGPNVVMRPACADDLPDLDQIRQAAFSPVFASFRSILGDEIYELAQARDDRAQGDLLTSMFKPESGWQVFAAELGGAVGRKWGFPPVLIAAIEQDEDEGQTPLTRTVVRAVQLADYLCESKGISILDVPTLRPPTRASLSALAIHRDGFRVLWEDLDAELTAVRRLFATG